MRTELKAGISASEQWAAVGEWWLISDQDTKTIKDKPKRNSCVLHRTFEMYCTPFGLCMSKLGSWWCGTGSGRCVPWELLMEQVGWLTCCWRCSSSNLCTTDSLDAPLQMVLYDSDMPANYIRTWGLQFRTCQWWRPTLIGLFDSGN